MESTTYLSIVGGVRCSIVVGLRRRSAVIIRHIVAVTARISMGVDLFDVSKVMSLVPRTSWKSPRVRWGWVANVNGEGRKSIFEKVQFGRMAGVRVENTAL